MTSANAGASLRVVHFPLVQLDLRHADDGRFGHIEGVRRVTGDPAREGRDRAVIAALGPIMAGEDLDHPSARTDARTVDLNVTDGWTRDAWRFLIAERARMLARHEPFRATWRAFVVRLREFSEFIELEGAQVDEFLQTPGAGLRSGAPRAGVATSHGARVHRAGEGGERGAGEPPGDSGPPASLVR